MARVMLACLLASAPSKLQMGRLWDELCAGLVARNNLEVEKMKLAFFVGVMPVNASKLMGKQVIPHHSPARINPSKPMVWRIYPPNNSSPTWFILDTPRHLAVASWLPCRPEGGQQIANMALARVACFSDLVLMPLSWRQVSSLI